MLRHSPAAFLLVCLFLVGCAATRTYVAGDYQNWDAAPAPSEISVAYEVFLLGNTGYGTPDAPALVYQALSRELARAGEASAVVFLGDLVSEGMPDSSSVGRADAEQRLERLAQAVQAYDGRVFAVPGDRDWELGEEGVERLEDALEDRLGRGDVMAPGDARPGPVVLELTDDLVLVLIDTAWWLTSDPRPDGDAGKFDDDEGDYEVENPFEMVLALEDALREYDDENVLVVGHHPLETNGAYGGYSTFTQHLLPPVIGSIRPLFRQFVGTRQDLANARYRDLRSALDEIFLAYDGVVYAAAHDLSLQVFPIEQSIRRTQHYLVSGSAADADPVASGRGAAFAASERGFMRLRYMDDASIWLDVMQVQETGESTVVFRQQLRETPREEVPDEIPDVDPAALPNYADSTVVQAINPDYAAGGLRQFFVGSGYRDAWSTPVEFPVLDLSMNGGLTPVKRGGGMQTVSLRLADAEGREYALRQLQKIPGRTLPEVLRRTIIADIIQELTSATIPWGATAVAELAEAVGVYHTNPRLVFVPDDPRLGAYRETFANSLALFEMRPDDDMSDFPNFGASENVVSSPSMLEDVEGDNDHLVDQRFFVKSRLFDMLLSDWDRHPDQWRWASYEPFELDPSLEGDARTDGKIYRPIPRDRDFAFYRLNGLIPSIAQTVEPKLQTFTGGYGNLRGLTTSGIPLDRRFANQMLEEDWVAEAEAIRASLTDEAIEAAFRTWPDAVYDAYGAMMVETLKERRDELPEVAEDVYHIQAEIVDVIGSNKRERFEVTRYEGGFTEVTVYDSNRDAERQRVLYQRRFDPRETHEIRLYGLGAGDFFFIEGDNDGAIRVRVIGGAGEDTFTNNTAGGALIFYDTENGNTITERGRASLSLNDAPRNNRYDPLDFKHPRGAFYPVLGYNSTDGAVLGLGRSAMRPGFRRHPWASTHYLEGAVATSTGGLRGSYRGHFFDVLGPDWDVTLDAAASTPRYVRNFYGFGNETADLGMTNSFFNVDITEATGALALVRSIEDLIVGEFGVGASYYKVENDPARFIGMTMLPASAFDAQAFADLQAVLTFQSLDVPANPRQGFRFTAEGGLHAGLSDAAPTFGRVGGDLAFYISPSLSPQFTLAARAGAGHLIGDTFPFYAAETLGGQSTMRGLVRQRYSGRTAFYQNVEVRTKLFNAFGYFVPTDVGLLAFVDNGRVWADNESSSVWHQGYGGGLWFSALDLFVFTGTVASGDDGVLVNIGLNFLY
ncbi:MAG: BamA/TamA family outer membrane protein [Rhodothermaceae bacterium]|nr:BamA/TamA family outer membrane protein [Rhodothermaceae bacterium]